jgi:hypothetical protein
MYETCIPNFRREKLRLVGCHCLTSHWMLLQRENVVELDFQVHLVFASHKYEVW